MKNLKRKLAFTFAVLGMAGSCLMFTSTEAKADTCWREFNGNDCDAGSGNCMVQCDAQIQQM